MATAATQSIVPELDAEVLYKGQRGVVTGFGSLAAACATVITDEPLQHPSGFVVEVAMGRYAIPRVLSLRELVAV